MGANLGYFEALEATLVWVSGAMLSSLTLLQRLFVSFFTLTLGSRGIEFKALVEGNL